MKDYVIQQQNFLTNNHQNRWNKTSIKDMQTTNQNKWLY